MSSQGSRSFEWARHRQQASRAAMLEPDQERELLARASEDPRALALLVDTHMRLVIRIASEIKHEGVDIDDLIAEGTLGLLEAIKRFDRQLDTRLATYAKWWIRARVRAFSLANRRLVAMPTTRAAKLALAKFSGLERSLTQSLGRAPRRDEVAAALSIPVEELDNVVLALTGRDLTVASEHDGASSDPEDPSLDPETLLREAEQRHMLAMAKAKTLAGLSARQKRVFEAQFSADDDAVPSLDLAAELGVTRQRISQIAIALRERLRINTLEAARAS